MKLVGGKKAEKKSREKYGRVVLVLELGHEVVAYEEELLVLLLEGLRAPLRLLRPRLQHRHLLRSLLTIVSFSKGLTGWERKSGK